MALNPKLTNLGANAEVDALSALLNGGFLDIYDGAQPATGDTAIGAQVLLASLTFGSPAFGAGAAGVATANAIGSDASANATGTASWYRCFKSDHTTAVQDGSVGTATSNCVLNSVAIQVGAQVSVDSFLLTASKG
jgi:hypothetical protein